MACPLQADLSLGPRVAVQCRALDFTLAFEDLVLACAPAAVFLALSPANIVAILRRPRTRSTWDKSLLLSLTIIVGFFVTQLALLVVRLQDEELQTELSLAADILVLLSIAAVGSLLVLTHQRSTRSSTLVSLYLSTTTIISIARVRTAWLIHPNDRFAGCISAVLAFNIAALVFKPLHRRTSSSPEKAAAPEIYSGFWSRITFVWLSKTFRTGYTQVFTVDDLPTLDGKLRSSGLHRELSTSWRQCGLSTPDYGPWRDRVDRFTDGDKSSYVLIRACGRAYMWSFLSAIVPRLALTLFTFLQPALITTTVTFVGETEASRTYGRALIAAWALVYLGLAVSNSAFLYQNSRFVTRVRGGLIAMIYEQSLSLRSVDAGDITAVAVMSTDVERIVDGLQTLHETWASLLDIGIAVWLLERQMGLACIAPVVLVLGFIGITSKISSAMNLAQVQWIGTIQERLRVTSIFLDDIKAVKMQGLTKALTAAIRDLRSDEIKTSATFRRLLIAVILLSITPMNLAPVATFAVYIGISLRKDQTLLTAQAFTSVALVSLLTNPVVVFTQTLPKAVQCIGCFARIERYCAYGHSGDSRNNHEDYRSQNDDTPLSPLPLPSGSTELVKWQHQSFRWEASGTKVLHEISVSISARQITAVIGPVGSGKTTLLLSILGEMIADPPIVQRATSIAYCAQETWLEHTSIRDNIVGGSMFDDKWYNTVVDACGLAGDLAAFEKGDATIIGSNGLNVSGGQKKRISLARAAYARCSTILLDDVFSGMDAHTAAVVSRRLLGPHGLFRRHSMTVVIVTHSPLITGFCDKVLVIHQGRVVESGRSSSVLAGEKTTASLHSASEQDAVDSAPPGAGDDHADMKSDEIAAASTDNPSPNYDLIADKARQQGDSSIYTYYISSAGYTAASLYLSSVLVWIFCSEFPTIWLKWWSAANETSPNKDIGLYMGVYAAFGVVASLGACATAWFAFIDMISNSATGMHEDLLRVIARAPFHFFAATNTGSILNRFSEDMQLIDMALPSDLVNFSSTAVSALAKAIILFVFARYLGAIVPVFGLILFILQRFYLRTSRQLRLLGIEAKAPLFTMFTETIAGAATIRAFAWQSDYLEKAYETIDTSQRPVYLLACVQHCLNFVLDIVVTVLVVILVAIVTTWKKDFSPGSVGVSLVMIVGFNTVLSRLIVTWTALESSIGAVARVKQFVTNAQSMENNGNGPDLVVSHGFVEFEGVSASYRTGTPNVLNNISLIIQPGQHLAICGKSGSGKSTLLLNLVGMIDCSAGSILIDGVDLANYDSETLCSVLNVVPQDPLLVPGSIRFNVDPSGTVDEGAIVEALGKVQLWSVVLERGGLESTIDAAAWSTGQKQLLCLARAIVRKSKILILDEATSSVDNGTETSMQDIIATEFAQCTVIAVMHRLEHLRRYDRVALMEKGAIVEYGVPTELLATDTEIAALHGASTP